MEGGGAKISERVNIFQHYAEIYVPGGPNISKYMDRGPPGKTVLGESKFVMTGVEG